MISRSTTRFIRTSNFTKLSLQNRFQLSEKSKPRSVDITSAAMLSHQDSESYAFGPYTIRGTEVFSLSPHSFAFVNLKPVVPGHVLVSPKRVLKRFSDLSSEEVSDLWQLAQKVGKTIEPYFGAESLTFAIQDGVYAGQTVPHVHIHILPRKKGDFENNDEVYDAIDNASKDMQETHRLAAGEKLDLDKERKVRTSEEMSKEASELRNLFCVDL